MHGEQHIIWSLALDIFLFMLCQKLTKHHTSDFQLGFRETQGLHEHLPMVPRLVSKMLNLKLALLFVYFCIQC